MFAPLIMLFTFVGLTAIDVHCAGRSTSFAVGIRLCSGLHGGRADAVPVFTVTLSRTWRPAPGPERRTGCVKSTGCGSSSANAQR